MLMQEKYILKAHGGRSVDMSIMRRVLYVYIEFVMYGTNFNSLEKDVIKIFKNDE